MTARALPGLARSHVRAHARGVRQSRRKFLGRVVGGVGLAALGGVGGLAWLRGCAPRVEGLRCLSAEEHRTFEALAEALFPEGGAFPLGARGLGLGRAFDAFLEGEDDDRQSDLKTALLLLEFGPLLYGHRLVTFSNLDAEGRLAHFEAWATSGDLVRREISLALRKFASFVFYDRPEAWPGIGYALPLPPASP